MSTEYKAIKNILESFTQISNERQARKILSQLLRYSNNWDVCRINFSQYLYGTLIWTVVQCYYVLGDYDNALKIAGEGIKKMEEDSEYFPNTKSRVYELMGQCYSQLGDKRKAVEAIEKMPYYDIFQLNTHWPKESFYSFRSVSEYSLQDLRNNTISLSSVFTFNDPVDSSFFPWIDKQLQEKSADVARKIYLESMREAFGKYRARCFVASRPVPMNCIEAKTPKQPFDDIPPYGNTLMWAHYANFHKGFCVEYNIPTEVTRIDKEEQLVVAMCPINYVESLPYKQEFSYIEAFLTKSKRWEYEHEVRMIYFKQGDNSANPVVSLGEDYEKSIKAVYLGIRCHKEHEAEILDIMKAHPNIPVYRMKVSNNDIYSLEAELISGVARIKPNYIYKKKSCWLCRVLETIANKLGCCN